MSETRRKAPTRKLLIEERRRAIVDRLRQHGRVTVDELVESYGVSAVTIRTDLESLEISGLAKRSHGGAVPADSAPQDVPLPIKEARRHAEKRRIGEAAARMIGDGETIILDSGSTTVEIARCIRQRKWASLTVITNALNIALELSGLPTVRVMMLGGMLRQTSYSLVGVDAERALSRFSADRLFLGVDGLDTAIGITTPDPQEASLNAMMVKCSREVIAVLDASKFGQRSLAIITPIDGVNVVITDTGAPRNAVRSLEEQGVKVIVV